MGLLSSHATPSIAAQSGLYVKGHCHAFFVPCAPPRTSHHAKRIVRTGRFTTLADSPRLVSAKASLIELLRPFQPVEPMAGPLVICVGWTWPWLASHGRKIRAAGARPHDHKPDLSNVYKTLEDRLVELRFIANDQSVVAVHLEKFWGALPGLDITIATLRFYRTWMAPGATPYAPATETRQDQTAATLPLEPEPGSGGAEPRLEPEAG